MSILGGFTTPSARTAAATYRGSNEDSLMIGTVAGLLPRLVMFLLISSSSSSPLVTGQTRNAEARVVHLQSRYEQRDTLSLSVQDAVERRWIHVEAQGSGITQLRVTVRRTAEAPKADLHLHIPAGTLFAGDPRIQQMLVITTPRLLLARDEQKAESLVPVVCADMHLAVPTGSNTLRLAANRSLVARAFQAVPPLHPRAGYSEQYREVVQAAVWIVGANPSWSELLRTGVGSRAAVGSLASGLAAAAYLGAAGFDMTATRIWPDVRRARCPPGVVYDLAPGHRYGVEASQWCRAVAAGDAVTKDVSSLVPAVWWESDVTIQERIARGESSDPSGPFGWSPLSEAVAVGRINVVRYLLDHGAPQVANAHGWTPLYLAAYWGDREALELLLLKGGDPNELIDRNYSLLTAAVDAGRYEIVEALLRQGANPNLSVGGAATPLIRAAAQGAVELVGLLLRSGADPDLASSTTALNAALVASPRAGPPPRERRRDVALALLEAGADPNRTGSSAGFPLLHAVRARLDTVAISLINHGADVRTACALPLTEALQSGARGVAQALLDKGAVPTTDAMTAAEQHLPDLVPALHQIVTRVRSEQPMLLDTLARARCRLPG
jgi:ankyrin repeat protein